MIVFGINPVVEALRAGRVVRVAVGPRHDPRLQALVEEARARGVAVESLPAPELERWSRGGLHQGVLAEVREDRAWDVGDLVAGAAGVPLLLVLDAVEDPQNVGAILRTCEAAGVDGVVRQTRRAAPLGPAVAKASAGALAHVRIASVVNIARALADLKASGVWVVGLAADGAQSYAEVDLTVPVAVVVGAEGSGLRRLVRESCDWVVRIPMQGRVGSLNVSVAAGVVLFEARRQRGRGA